MVIYMSKMSTYILFGKQVTSYSLHDSHQRIEKEINTFWNPLGRHFVCGRCQSIYEPLHVVLTRKNIYVEKLRDIYTSNSLQIWIHMY